MTLLVTQTEALRQLRLNATTISSDELADALAKAEQASDIVCDYIKRNGDLVALVINPLDIGDDDDDDFTIPPTPPPLNTNGTGLTTPPLGYGIIPWTDVTCPPLIKGAILIILTSLYDGRTPNDELLSGPVTSMLWRYRDPALS
jgi:hypothetical protein